MNTPTPKQIAQRLHTIAKSLENSKAPDPNRVASALQEVILRISTEGWIDADTIAKTLEGAIRGGKLSPEEEKHAKAMIESLRAEEKKEKKTASEPAQVSSALRQIAFQIDASTRPDPKLIMRDIRRVMSSISK